jgi:hypothetical protein
MSTKNGGEGASKLTPTMHWFVIQTAKQVSWATTMRSRGRRRVRRHSKGI